MRFDIPAEGRIPFLDQPVALHWDNHALLMFTVWFVLVPIAVLLLRFGKVPPSTYGIPRGTPKWAWPEFCWSLHKRLLSLAMALSLGGAALALTLTGGFSGSLHGWFGLSTVALGALQIISAWFRGSHGGRKDPAADPDDRSTWGGDHFDMTPRRRWFEALHKTAGYFAVFCAGAAVATGLAQYWLPAIAVGLAVVVAAALGLAVVLQGLGHNHDTYLSVYGTHPLHPFNRRRFDALFREQDRRP